MIKLKNLGLVGILALLVFGTAANAQTASMFMQSSNSTEAVPDDPNTTDTNEAAAAVSSAALAASELFGSGAVKLEFGATGFAPIYKLTYVQAMTADTPPVADPTNSIEDADEGMITYTLSGAVFNERVSPNDFMIAGDTAATLEVTADGAKGDSSVTIKITAGAAWTGANTITFTIPDLSATPGRTKGVVNPVRITSSYMLSTQSNFPEGSPKNANCDDATKATPAQGCRIVNAQDYVAEFTLGGAGTGNIDLADRTKLIAGEKHVPDIAIGTVTVKAAAGTTIKDQDGTAVTFAGDLAGDVVITVQSDQFRDGDIVYIDDDGDKKPGDSRERLSITDGKATTTRDLEEDTDDAKCCTWTVRYVPNGEDALMHDTEMKLSAMTDFTNRDNMNSSAKAGDATSVTSSLLLNGIRPNPAKAYAVAPIGSTDTANVRITCENAKKCNAFLSCYDGSGMDYFGEAGVEVPANGTVRLNQDELSEALGMMAGESWSGRLSCDVLSTAPVSVQVLTRAAGVLVNNTYVGEGGR